MRSPDTKHGIGPVRQAFFSILLLGITLVLCLLAAEAFLRIKNGAMDNYDIEMWRYANELKQKKATTRRLISITLALAERIAAKHWKFALNSFDLDFGARRSARCRTASGAFSFSADRSRSAGACQK